MWVRPILHASCVDIGPDGVDEYFGYGRLNLKNACDLAFAYADDERREGGGAVAAVGPDGATSAAAFSAAEERAYFRCYPNPAEGPIKLTGFLGSDKPEAAVDVKVYDLSGRCVNAFTVPTSGGSYSLSWDLTARDGSRVPPGVYVITASNGAERSARKVVVAR